MSERVVELAFPAHARYLVLARLSMAGVASVAQLGPEELADLKLAVTEACANVVRHAYPDGGGDVRVRIVVEAGAVTVEVRDSGRGMPPGRIEPWDPSALHEQGMGLSIVRSVVDDLEIDSPATGGTLVRFTKRVGAPAP